MGYPMASYRCSECGFSFSEEEGCEGLPAGTSIESVPDFCCPDCGAERTLFLKVMPNRVFVCSMCGFRYEEAKGSAKAGLSAGTAWETVPEDFKCPLCGCPKNIFKKYRDEVL